MGHWCRVCGKTKPNEKFSGKGHQNHICKECSRKPKEERDAIDQEDEIFGYLKQSNISKKNIARLEKLKASKIERISELASIAFDVAKIKPNKKKRLKFLARENQELLLRLEETGLIMVHHY